MIQGSKSRIQDPGFTIQGSSPRSFHEKSGFLTGFTLIELLIAIAIVAVLATVTLVAINPTELLKQTRDTTRFSDLATINKALSIYQIEQSNIGSSTTVYISAPDSSATCVNLGLATLPSGWSYACVTAQNSRNVNGTGWIPVNLNTLSISAPISALPVDPVNSVSRNLYYSYVVDSSGWILKAQTIESAKFTSMTANDGGASSTAYEVGTSLASAPYVYPNNWVKVLGNSTFGTSDFYVMKYDAKCIQTSGNQVLTAPDTGYHTYSNTTQPCTGSYYVGSSFTGYPIANISHTTAVSYCTAIGAHLLTNDEYMTIVRNAEQVASNWTNGSVGSGALYSGHNDNSPATALEASADDSNGYFGTGNSSPSNQRRTSTLSNNSTVWDFAGNIWQHVQRSTMNSGDATNVMALPACSDGVAGWGWCQYGNSTTPYVSSWTSDVVRDNVGPSNTSWNSSQGMGQVYTYKNGTSQGTTVFRRGGLWTIGSLAGAFTLHLGWGTGAADYHVGFRCAR